MDGNEVVEVDFDEGDGGGVVMWCDECVRKWNEVKRQSKKYVRVFIK